MRLLRAAVSGFFLGLCVNYAEAEVVDGTYSNQFNPAQQIDEVVAVDDGVVDYSTRAQTVAPTRPKVAAPAPRRPLPPSADVVNAMADPANATEDLSGLSLEQRMMRLESQTGVLQKQRVLEQVNALQQQVQTLQGQLEVLTHQQQMIQAQQRDFYQDLEKRITKVASKEAPAKTTVAAALPAITKPIGQQETSRKEQDAYQHAYTYIKEKKYQQGITAMESYLKTYPDGHYAMNADYWLGELYLINSDEATAKQHFKHLVTKYPNQAKAGDAMLKLGMIAADSNDLPEAKKQYKAVLKQYPNTTSARLAQQSLQKLSATDG